MICADVELAHRATAALASRRGAQLARRQRSGDVPALDRDDLAVRMRAEQREDRRSDRAPCARPVRPARAAASSGRRRRRRARCRACRPARGRARAALRPRADSRTSGSARSRRGTRSGSTSASKYCAPTGAGKSIVHRHAQASAREHDRRAVCRRRETSAARPIVIRADAARLVTDAPARAIASANDARAAVERGDLGPVDRDQRVVDPHSSQRREHVLDRRDATARRCRGPVARRVSTT